MSKKELKPVFNNCPYLYKVIFDNEDESIFVFSETTVGAIQVASTQINHPFRKVEIEVVCFANDIINLNKVFK